MRFVKFVFNKKLQILNYLIQHSDVDKDKNHKNKYKAKEGYSFLSIV